MKAIHQNDYCAIGNQHEHVTSRINDMLIEFQNHAYQTGVERGKQQVIEANAAAGKIPPTLCTTVHLGANQATIETGHMLNPAGEEVATLTIANHGTEVRLSFETQTQASLVLHALLVHKDYRVVPTEGLRQVHRDLDACQKVMWLAGCQPQVPNGFDGSYVTDAQARLADIDGWIVAAGLPMAQQHEQCSVLEQVNVRYSNTTTAIPLAANHNGMRIDASGVLGRVGGQLKLGAREMLKHLEQMAEQFYAGDLTAVDEFLQLFCLDQKRPAQQSEGQ
tara:strand:+ start:149 stop:982 length:834 start_codon:yes stop_codon:yes gene_type:complete